MRWLVAILAFSLSGTVLSAYEEPVLTSYTRLSANKQFLFVMLHPPRKEIRDPLAEKYSQTGLYRNDGSKKSLWTVEAGYSREVYPASDGLHAVLQHLHVIGIEGRKCGNSPEEPPVDPVVLSFYASGRRVRNVRLSEVLDHERFCKELGPGWHGWMNSASIDEAEKHFVLVDRDGKRVAFDLASGERIGGPVQLANSAVQSMGAKGRTELGLVLVLLAAAGFVSVIRSFLRSKGNAVAGRHPPTS